MSTINLELEDELVAFLSSSNQPIERAVAKTSSATAVGITTDENI